MTNLLQTKQKEWKEDFKKLKEVVFKEDKIVQAKYSKKIEYLHKTLPEVNLSNGKVYPSELIVNHIKEGSIDSREITVIEKTFKQSYLVEQFIENLLHKRDQAIINWVIEEIKKEYVHMPVNINTFDYSELTGREAGNNLAIDRIITHLKSLI